MERRDVLLGLGLGVAALGVGRSAQSAETVVGGDVAGKVSRVQGTVVAVYDAAVRVLQPGASVYVGDVLSTGAKARIEIQMIDDGVFTLGERTSFNIFDYRFGTGPQIGLMSGVLDAVSGSLGKVGDGLIIDSPVATIGIRGTKFWIGELDGKFQVAHWSGGGVHVENKGGAVLLKESNSGTFALDRNDPPAPPTEWGGLMKARAKHLVAFAEN